jgi:hypothetical protein
MASRLAFSSRYFTPLLNISLVLSSLVVAVLLSYFINALRHEFVRVPWVLLFVSLRIIATAFAKAKSSYRKTPANAHPQIMATSTITILTILSIAVLRLCTPASPLLTAVLRFPIFVLWTVSLGFISAEMATHLKNSCGGLDAIGGRYMVIACRMFKALFAFLVISVALSLAGLLVDVILWWKSKKGTGYSIPNINRGGKTSGTISDGGVVGRVISRLRSGQKKWKSGDDAVELVRKR